MEQEEKIKAFLEHLLDKHDTYHHQKENMAHAGIMLQAAIFGGIISITHLENTWLAEIASQKIFIIFVLVIWMLLHIYIRIQLRLKRWAAINYAGCFRAFREFVNKDFKTIEILPSNIPGYRTKEIFSHFDLLIPIPTSQIKSDVGNEDYPKFIANKIQEQYDEHKTGSSRYEWFLTIASYTMLIIIILRFVI